MNRSTLMVMALALLVAGGGAYSCKRADSAPGKAAKKVEKKTMPGSYVTATSEDWTKPEAVASKLDAALAAALPESTPEKVKAFLVDPSNRLMLAQRALLLADKPVAEQVAPTRAKAEAELKKIDEEFAKLSEADKKTRAVEFEKRRGVQQAILDEVNTLADAAKDPKTLELMNMVCSNLDWLDVTLSRGSDRLPSVYIAEQSARVGVALLEAGQLHTLGEGEFPLMSVVKLHQACYVLHRMAELGLRPENTLLIHYSELRQDTYSPMLQEYRDSVFRLSLRDLLTYSLQLSDNNACDILFRHFGGPAELQRYMQSLGIDCKIGATEAEMHDTPARINDNRSTPASVARLISLIAERRLGLPPTYADLLDELLSGCKTGTARIAAGLPPGATLLHKTGTGPCTPTHTCGVNDAAYIILPNGRRYILVIFCAEASLSLPQTEAILAEISARIAAE